MWSVELKTQLLQCNTVSASALSFHILLVKMLEKEAEMKPVFSLTDQNVQNCRAKFSTGANVHRFTGIGFTSAENLPRRLLRLLD